MESTHVAAGMELNSSADVLDADGAGSRAGHPNGGISVGVRSGDES